MIHTGDKTIRVILVMNPLNEHMQIVGYMAQTCLLGFFGLSAACFHHLGNHGSQYYVSKRILTRLLPNFGISFEHVAQCVEEFSRQRILLYLLLFIVTMII